MVGYKFAKKTEYGMNEAEDIIWEHDEDLNVRGESSSRTEQKLQLENLSGYKLASY